MAMKFNGFPTEMFKFLKELSANNNRAWFNANKGRYEQAVVAPVIEFITAFDQRLGKISENFITDTRRNGGSMFRIYRDTRFSRDKRPYKENVGCQFRHVAGKDAHAPGFYLHIEPGNSGVGVGMWTPPTAALSKVRDAIVADPDRWRAVEQQLAAAGLTFMGTSLKRAPRGYDADHEHVEALKRKSCAVHGKLSDADVTSDDLSKRVAGLFAQGAPLVELLCKSQDLPFQ